MRIAYGFWRYGNDDLDTAISMIDAARNAGITHFDTADVYGYPDFGAAEALLGSVRTETPSLLDGVQIATKAGVEIGTPYNSSKAYIAQAIDASLRRLKCDCIDIFYIHRPDFMMHPAELAATLDEIVTAGKAKTIGVSNYTAAQLHALSTHLTTPISAHQVEFSALHVDPVHNGVFDHAMARTTDVYAWSPLAGGRLFDGDDIKSQRVRRVLEEISQNRHWPITTVALAFVLSHPAQPTAIVGTKNSARLLELVQAAKKTLERKEWYDVYQASCGESLP